MNRRRRRQNAVEGDLCAPMYDIYKVVYNVVWMISSIWRGERDRYNVESSSFANDNMQ